MSRGAGGRSRSSMPWGACRAALLSMLALWLPIGDAAAQSGGPQPEEPQASPPQAVLDLKSLVEQGRFAEAFELGLRNDSLVGDPLFDYYFGVAAIDSGRASLGVLALERVLLSNPGNDLVRLELARGYFVLSDFERAREEFTIMAGKQLPAPVRASVDRYLAAIRDQDPAFRRVFRSYAEFAGGTNSNVNSVAAGEVPFPLFGPDNPPIFVSPGATERSALSQLALGASVNGPLKPGLKYLGTIDLNHRQHAEIEDFDQTSGAVSGGIEFSGETDRYRAFGYGSQAYLDGDRLRDTVGVAVDWLRPIREDASLRSVASYSQLRYGPQAVSRDSDLGAFSVGYNMFKGGPWKLALDGELNIAREDNQRGNGYLSRTILGGRFALGAQPGPRLQASLVVSYAVSDYDEPDPVGVLLEDKVDDLFGVELALQYQLTRGWSVRGEYLLNKNSSNEKLYEYEQQIALVKLRYEWR